MIKKISSQNISIKGWRDLMNLVFIPFIRCFGIETYDLIGILANLQAWLGLLDMGMWPVLGREMARFTGGAYHGYLKRVW